MVSALKAQGHKILWAPDRHLGDYIRRETGAGEIHVGHELGARARVPVDRMLAFAAALKKGLPTAGLVAPH